MKRIFLFAMLFSCLKNIQAQDITKSAAMDLVNKNKAAIGVNEEQLKNSLVSNAYFDQISGLEMVYLQQTYKGLPIFNQVQTLAFKNGIVVSVAGKRLNNMEQLTNKADGNSLVGSENAVKTAILSKNIISNQPLIGVQTKNSNKIDFGSLGIARERITAELMWVPTPDVKEIKLAWQVYLVPNKSSDYWLIHVDASANGILSELNLTVYCDFDGGKSHDHNKNHSSAFFPLLAQSNEAKKNSSLFGPAVINGATYRVIPFPAESPIHPGGAPDLRTNPWTLAPGNASSLKWHSDGTNDYTITRGNNVWAAEDRDGSNTTIGLPATSTTSTDPLSFDFPPNLTVTPTQTTPVQNQQFNTTNLFYWNNIIHDLVYQYGFDEVSGNFQVNNQGRGGLGNDYVVADAQDGGGTNNANFSTPADGSSGRMQMYLWNGSPQKDGDVDNGVIVHEFSHGISNRLAGGPAQAGCVSNGEQMGEGWSDYYSLMATQDWTTSLLTDGNNKPRGIGTYVIGQAASGVGIRSQKYCTNFAVNNKVYAATIPGTGLQHSRGEIWCATLWDMTWNIINQVGSINPNMFNASGSGGNSIALKLVTEGLKLQVCNSGFIDGRDGILKADQILYGGAYRCAIMEAFARRGMGFDASQGSANSTTDQIPGFSTVESVLTATQNLTQQLEGLNVTYNNKVTAGTCNGLTNHLLTDTLPSNVTYVSGGIYNAANRVVSFSVNMAAGQSQTYSFTVQINSGSWFPSTNLIDEQVLTTSIPANWSTTSINTSNFVVSAAQSQSTPNAYFGVNATGISDFSISTSTPIALGTTPPTLSFWHNYNTEDGWDGGVVEMSTNGGTSWIDLGSYMTQNGYNGSMGTGSNNPLGGRSAFTGNSNGFIKTTVSLLPFVNQSALFRFRAGSDDNTAITGWYIDDVLLQSRAVVNIRSNLFNAAGVRVNIRDTFTIILQNAACTAASVTTAPSNTSTCAGTNTSFSVVAAGTSITYQWQVSANGGLTFSNITGATSVTLPLTAVTNAMNNNQYRVIVSNACPSSSTSTAAILTVSDAATVTTAPANASVCLNGNTSFSATASGTGLTYQWQVSTNGGTTFSNISGATSATLNLTGVSAAMNNNQYRVVVYSCGPTGTNSNSALLTITSPANFTSAPASVTVCPGSNTTFTAVANGSNLSYQWQISMNNGVSFSNIPGAINPSLNLMGISLLSNGNQYRVIINGTCTVDLASAPATLSVNTPVTINTHPLSISSCVGSLAQFTVSAVGTALSYQWQESINGGVFRNLANGGVYSGVNSAILSITGSTIVMNGYAYRVLVTGTPCGTVISNVASYILHPLPAVVLAAAEYNRINPAVPTSLYTTVSPVGANTYEWFRNTISLNGIVSSSYSVNVDKLGNYSVIVTDVNGCKSVSNQVNVSDSASNQLFIFPNPNNGQFQVRFFNPNAISQERTLSVYDSKGAKVYSKTFISGPSYDKMEVSLPNIHSGVYNVDLRDINGKRLASGALIIQ